MKNLFIIFLVTCIFLSATKSAKADGRSIFNSNCAACHLAGGNAVNPEKTLQQNALKQYLANYSTDGEAAIITQVTNGKGAMPPFSDRLNSFEISEVSSYVEAMSIEGWN